MKPDEISKHCKGLL